MGLFPQHLCSSGNQTGSDQHGCTMPGFLKGCKTFQHTPSATAWRSCWWSLLPPSPQKKTKTSRKEDKQEIGWQTVQPQVAFNIRSKPLGNREVVTSTQVIFCSEENPQCHNDPLWKGGKAESNQHSESVDTRWVGHGTKQNKAAVLFAQPRGDAALVSPVSDNVAETMKTGQPQSHRRTQRASGSCFSQTSNPDVLQHQLCQGESLRKQRAQIKSKQPCCFPCSLYRKTLARPISSSGIKCDSTVR